MANKRAEPPFDPQSWYRPWKRSPYWYNSVVYKPIGWNEPCRLVAMGVPKEEAVSSQGELFEKGVVIHTVFLHQHDGAIHKVIAEYGKKTDVENLIVRQNEKGFRLSRRRSF